MRQSAKEITSTFFIFTSAIKIVKRITHNGTLTALRLFIDAHSTRMYHKLFSSTLPRWSYFGSFSPRKRPALGSSSFDSYFESAEVLVLRYRGMYPSIAIAGQPIRVPMFCSATTVQVYGNRPASVLFNKMSEMLHV